MRENESAEFQKYYVAILKVWSINKIILFLLVLDMITRMLWVTGSPSPGSRICAEPDKKVQFYFVKAYFVNHQFGGW